MIYVINTFTAISMQNTQLKIYHEFIGIATLRQETSKAIKLLGRSLLTLIQTPHVLSHLLCCAVLGININNVTDIPYT